MTSIAPSVYSEAGLHKFSATLFGVNTMGTRNPACSDRVATYSGNATSSEGVYISYHWYYLTNTSVPFPFGYGLSHTACTNDEIELSDCFPENSTMNRATIVIQPSQEVKSDR